MDTAEQIVSAFHDPAYCRNAGRDTIHIIREGKVLCGSSAWLTAMPMQLLEDDFWRRICRGCLRVERSRKPPRDPKRPEMKQLTMEV